jgi:hypothetical protein
MASIDHTARVRPLVRNEPKSKSPASADRASHAPKRARKGRLNQASQRAGAALAVAVLEGMLKMHRVSKHGLHVGRHGLPPFNPVQLIGLETAIDLLNRYVDILSPDTGG